MNPHAAISGSVRGVFHGELSKRGCLNRQACDVWPTRGLSATPGGGRWVLPAAAPLRQVGRRYTALLTAYRCALPAARNSWSCAPQASASRFQARASTVVIGRQLSGHARDQRPDLCLPALDEERPTSIHAPGFQLCRLQLHPGCGVYGGRDNWLVRHVPAGSWRALAL